MQTIEMEKIVIRGTLYDFYGELLTDHQKNIYEDAVLNDMSLGEVAGLHGVSRQAVHDIIKRCDKMLEDYENKLHLVEKFEKVRDKVENIRTLTKDVNIRELADQILEDL